MINQYIKSMRKISGLLDLEFNYSPAHHNFETGLPLEGALRNFFTPYFPKRYGFTSGYLIDENEKISNQCDWIIYDAINIPPIMHQDISSGLNWIPFDGAFGCVEIKRNLTSKTLKKAIKQIEKTKGLSRTETNILHIHPIKNFPPKFFNIPANIELKTTNSFYSGIYAYSIDEELNANDIINNLISNEYNIPFESLPDYIAVHGKFFIRKCKLWENDAKIGWRYTFFPKDTNGYALIETTDLTSGFFYFDLLTQFANMDISAQYQMSMLPAVTKKLISKLPNKGYLFNGKDYVRPTKKESATIPKSSNPIGASDKKEKS